MNVPRLILCRLFAQLCVLSPLAAGAATVYVTPEGSDSSGSGTWAAPYATIQKGIDAASVGDTVVVRPGSYSGAGNRQINFNGKSLRLVSEAGPLQTIVDCGQGRIAILNNAENSSTLIRGFTFRNAYVNQSGDWATAVLFEMSNSSPVIENCIFRDNRAEGTFYTGTSGATILSSGSGRPTVRNCLFYNNTVKSGDNATGADLIRGDYQSIENCTIANNTIDAFMINWWYYITKSVLRVFALNSTTAVRNCVVWGNTISEIGPRSERSPRTEPLSQPTASHTLFQSTLPGTNIINVDPQFRDAAGGDFGLLAGSPAKDTGDPASTPDPDGTRADMGYFVAKSGGNAATVPFADNFESGSLGSSWNISSTRGNGFARVNSTKPQAGTNSLNMGITAITSPQNSSSSDVSLKFDRALAQGVIELDLFVERSSRHYTYLVLEAAGQWSAGAALTDFQTTINPGWWQSTTVSTNLPRSDGWAKFKWIVDGDNVELKVNGTTVAKGKSHGPVTGLSLVLQSVQSNVQTYIDNVRVTDSLAGEDTQAPLITLLGTNPMSVYKGSVITDPGATVSDNIDASRTISGTGTVNTSVLGSYTITYSAQDASGNKAASVQRTINVVLDPAGDEDGDGVTNYREVADGTDPGNPSSFNSLNKGLVAFYPFVGNANDESGFNNHGSAAGATLGASRDGSAENSYYFNGASHIQIPNSESLSFGMSDVTVSAWIKTTNSGFAFIYSDDGDARRPGFEFSHAGSATYYEFSNYEIWGGTSDGLNPVNDGKWHHLVLTFSRSVIRTYVDGKLDMERVNNGWPALGTISNSRDSRIGANIGNGPERFLGSIDDMRLYRRALSESEVQSLYLAEAGNLDSDGDGLSDAWERGFGRYQIVPGYFTWDQAKAGAEARGGHLATITTESEWTFLWAVCGPLWNAEDYWLGATDRVQESNWQWVTGETWGYARWCPNEPSGGPENELISWTTLPDQMPGWNDGSGDVLPGSIGGYILEFGYPTDPTKADTDGDGYDDKVESDAGTDPNNSGDFPVVVGLDSDGDGVSNYREEADGTDPHDPASFHALSKGLLAYYPFNGNANDESGFARNTSVFAAVPASDAHGNAASAYSFNGSSSYMSVAGVPAPADGQFTWSAWINAADVAKEMWLINRVQSVGVNLVEPALVINKDTANYGRSPDASLALYTYGSSEQKLYSPAAAVPLGKWIQVAATRDIHGLGAIYVNGVKVAEDPTAALDNLTTFVFGANGQIPTFFFRGSMDNIRIYNRCLPLSELQQIFASEAGDLDSDGDGLTDAWEEGIGRYQGIQGGFTWEEAKVDASSRGGHLGTITSEQEWEAVKGSLIGQSLNSSLWLGGTDATQATVWQWVTGERWTYSRWHPSEPNDYFGYQSENGLEMANGSADWKWNDLPSNSPGYRLGYLLEFGYPTDPHKADTDGDGYDDKVESNSETDPNDASVFPDVSGADNDGDGVTNFRELADETDPNDPNSFNVLSKGLLAYYPMDGNTEDYSGRRRHALNFGAAPVAGRSGAQQSAYAFNGSSAYMDTPVDSNLPRLTISAWFRADSTSGERSIVDSDIGGNYGHSLILGYWNGDNTLDVQYHNGSFDSGWSPSTGAWHHAVAVYEPGLVTLYVDGTLKGQWGYSGAAPDGSNFRIGRHNATDPQWFKGGIDDVRIYDRALSGEEVGALYQQEIGSIDSDGDGLSDAWERGFGRYQVVAGNFSWHQAKADAVARGGHLATVTSDVESKVVAGINNRLAWIGGTDESSEGQWKWVTGERFDYAAWWSGNGGNEPDNYLGNQHYLITHFGGDTLWGDTSSIDSGVTAYVLEFGYPTDPNKADTDGDGYDDKVESDAGTDPNDSTAYPGDDDVAGPPPSGQLMTDVTSFASTMPEHGLIAVLDYDNDGRDDLLVGTGQGVRLWRSRGPFDFQDVTSAAGLDGITPAVVADFNNDGLADILSIDASRTGALVFANNGQASFVPHSVPSALAADLAAYRDIQSADIDNDGDLDLLYAVNPSFGGGAVAALFNTSSGGNLSFGTKTYLVRTSWIYAKFDSTDANGDGKTDLVVLQTNGSWPNDTHPNHPASLYLNTGSVPGDYANPDGSRMLAGFTEKAGCGIDSGNEMSRFTSWDMDNDGDLDLINGSSDWPWVSRPHVYLNNGAGTYTQQDSPVYQSGNYYHHGITIFDADLDNDLDAVWTGLHNFANIYPRMWENLSGGSFQDSTSAWGVTASIPGSGNLGSGGYAADLDGDGDQDFVVQGWNGWGPEKYFRIYRNDANVRGSKWLKVELVGLVSPAQGRGARVEVIAGGKKLVQYLGHDVGGMATTTLHFGLGGNSAAASVKVYWPSGAVSELANVTANQVLQITEDSAADDVIPPIVTVGPDPADNAVVRTPQITFTGGVAEDRGFPVLEYRRADQTWQQIPLLSSTNPFTWQQTVSLEASAVTSVLLAPGHAWEYTFTNPTSDVVLWNAAVGSGNGWSRGPAPFGNVRNGGDFDYATYWPEDPYDWNPALWDDDLWVRTTVDLTHVDLNSVRWFMGVDNGYKLYVNGVLVSANNAEHYTWKWEYSGDFGPALVQGVNVIAVALEDHGGLTAFDMQITGRSLLPGVNTFEFRARDEAGNVSDSVFRTVRYVPDSDSDGVIDYREIKDGTDPTNPSSFNPFSKDLLAYYPFSGTAEDESGYANHFLSLPQFGADRSGLASKAASFSEVPPIETPATRLPASGYTISTWIKLDRLPSEVGERMLVHGSWNAGSGAFSIATWSDLAVAFSWRAANGAQSEIRSDSGILSLGKWHQVTCAVSPTETRMFVNGQLLEAKPSEIASFLAPLVCGGDDGHFFDSGSLDEIRIYERALDDSEVQALYVEELGDIVPPVLTLAPEPADGAVIGQPSATYSGTVKEMSGQPTVEVRPAGAEAWTQVALGTPAIAFPWDKLPSGARDVRLSVFVNGAPFKTYDTPPLVFDFVPAAPGASTVVFQGTDSNGSTTHLATLTYPEDFDLQPVYPWSSTVALSAGTNSFQFRARDTVGNVSAIITRNLSYTIPPTYSVAVLTTAGGSVSPDTSNQEFIGGSVLQFSAQAQEGFEFLRWTGFAQGTNNPLSLTITNNTTLGAVFTRLEAPDASPSQDYTGASVLGTGPSGAAVAGANATAGSPDGSFVSVGDFAGSFAFSGETLSASGSRDGFVVKHGPYGAPQWCATFGAAWARVQPTCVAVDGEGRITVAGTFTGTVDFGSGPVPSRGGTDIFVARLSANGEFVWAATAGGSGNESLEALVSSPSGHVFVTGAYLGADCRFGSNQLSSALGTDAYLARVAPGGDWSWVRVAGGASSDSGTSLALGPEGLLWWGGNFQGTMSAGDHSVSSTGGSDMFVGAVQRVDGLTVSLERFGSPSADKLEALAADGYGGFYAAGGFTGSLSAGAESAVSAGGMDGFVGRFQPNVGWTWLVAFRGENEEMITSLATDDFGRIYVAGYFDSADLSAGSSSCSNTFAMSSDAFVGRLSGRGGVKWLRAFGGEYEDLALGLAHTALGGLQIVGYAESGFTVGEYAVPAPAGYADAYFVRVGGASSQEARSVNVSAGPGGFVELQPEGSNFPLGTLVEVTALPNTGYAFSGWSGDAEGAANPYSFIVERSVSIRASFTDIAPPTIDIQSPAADGGSKRQKTRLSGRVTDNGQVASATWSLNGAAPQNLPLDSDGNFDIVNVSLAEGENTIVVEALDVAGNIGAALRNIIWSAERSFLLPETSQVKDGQKISIPVRLTSGGEVGGFSLLLTYDPAVFTNPGFSFSGPAVQGEGYVTADVGSIRVVYSGAGQGIVAGTHLIGEINLRARTVPAGARLDSLVDLQVLDASDAAGQPLDGGTAESSCLVTVSSRGKPGDANGNGNLDAGDAAVMKGLIATPQNLRPWDSALSDLNSSGSVDSGDLTKLLRIVAGLDEPPADFATPQTRSLALSTMTAFSSAASQDVVNAPYYFDREGSVPVEVRVTGDLDDNQIVAEVIVPASAPSLNAAQFVLSYPAEVTELVSWERGSAAPAETFIYATGPGTLAFVASDNAAWAADGGVLLRVVLRPKNIGATVDRKLVTLGNLKVFTGDGYEAVITHQRPGRLQRKPEEWIAEALGASANPDSDDDKDGFTNRQEYSAGTNPRDSSSVFKITGFSHNASTRAQQLIWNAVYGVKYRIVSSENLRDWLPVSSTDLVGNEGVVAIDVQPPLSSKKLFYRVQVID